MSSVVRRIQVLTRSMPDVGARAMELWKDNPKLDEGQCVAMAIEERYQAVALARPIEEHPVVPATLMQVVRRLEELVVYMAQDLQYCGNHLVRLWDGDRLEDGSPNLACLGTREFQGRNELRQQLKGTLTAMGVRHDLNGHCIVDWPETERLEQVAARCGDRTPDKLREQCEELAGNFAEWTPGDALDYMEALVEH